MSDIKELYYPDDNKDINSDEEIINFLKEQKSVNTDRKATSATVGRFLGSVAQILDLLL